MKIIKWVILFVVLASCFSENCRTNDTENTVPSPTQLTLLQLKRDLLNSFVSLLYFNTGDLTEETTHTNADKKSFLKLFIYLRNSNIITTGTPQNAVQQNFRLPVPDPVDYYVYALQKMII